MYYYTSKFPNLASMHLSMKAVHMYVSKWRLPSFNITQTIGTSKRNLTLISYCTICDEIERNRSDLSSTLRQRDKVGGGVCRESTLPGRALNFLP